LERELERPVALPPTRIVMTGDGRRAPFATWGRRVISISLFATAGLGLIALLPLLLPLALLIDGVRRRNLATTRALLFFVLFFACETAGVAIAAWLWLRHLKSSRERFAGANFALQCWWTRTLQRGAFRIFSLRPEIEGAELATPGPVVAMFRHCSVADTLLPMMLIAIPHRIVLRWVLKIELLWDPCMDVVGSRMRNIFVSRMPETNTRDTEAVGTLMTGLGPTDGVALYPEGTRFSEAKRLRLIDKLGARAAAFENVLPPRPGGALALLDRNDAKADVIFCAHTGFEGISTLGDLLNGSIIGNTIHIKLWRVPFAQIPSTREGRIAWLHEHWIEVDRFITRTKAKRPTRGRPLDS
jgi:1-acyl-sn-glycerol-3-phosphate acyltransferase